jgi:hypothetical protein
MILQYREVEPRRWRGHGVEEDKERTRILGIGTRGSLRSTCEGVRRRFA